MFSRLIGSITLSCALTLDQALKCSHRRTRETRESLAGDSQGICNPEACPPCVHTSMSNEWVSRRRRHDGPLLLIPSFITFPGLFSTRSSPASVMCTFYSMSACIRILLRGEINKSFSPSCLNSGRSAPFATRMTPTSGTQRAFGAGESKPLQSRHPSHQSILRPGSVQQPQPAPYFTTV